MKLRKANPPSAEENHKESTDRISTFDRIYRNYRNYKSQTGFTGCTGFFLSFQFRHETEKIKPRNHVNHV
jgi:hypothetical protein